MKNSFEGGSLTPEQQEAQDKRDKYENQAEKDAKKANTFLENIKGAGLSREDIVYMDAEYENRLRDKLLSAKDPDKERFAEYLLREQKSTLTDTDTSRSRSHLLRETEIFRDDRIEGLVEGKKLVLEYDDKKKEYSGFFDGQRLSPGFAKEVYKKYYDTAQYRTKQIEELKEGKEDQIEKEREKFKELT